MQALDFCVYNVEPQSSVSLDSGKLFAKKEAQVE